MAIWHRRLCSTRKVAWPYRKGRALGSRSIKRDWRRSGSSSGASGEGSKVCLMIFAIRDSAQYVLTAHAPQPYAPLLMTEHVRSLEPHVDFALAEATDFLRGDVGYDGITGVMKLAHAAEGLGLDIEFHGPGPAQRQCMAAVRNTNYYEMGLVHPHAPASHDSQLYKDGYRDTLDAIDSDGCVPVPQGPGLGVEIDWEWVAHNRTSLVSYP